MHDFDRILEILVSSFPTLLQEALLVTLPLAAASFALGMLLALAIAFVRLRRTPALSGLAAAFVWLVRGTPLLVQLFVIFYGLPSLGIMIDPVPAAVAAFTFSVGAYASETLRGALESIPQGQWAAARALGLRTGEAYRHVILPQALRTAFPGLMNHLISLVKDTSLAASVTVAELFLASQRIAAETFEPFWLYVEAGAVYLLVSTALTGVQAAIERRFERRSQA